MGMPASASTTAAAASSSPPEPSDSSIPTRLDALKRLFRWPTWIARVFTKYNSFLETESAPMQAMASVRQQVPQLLADLDDETHPADLDGDSTVVSALKVTCDKIDAMTMSTSFSGIETPATALLMVGYAFACELGVPMENAPHIRHKYAIEWNAQARGEILRHPRPPDHLFGNIEDFWVDSVRAKLETLKEQNLIQDVLIPLVKSTNCSSGKAWCYKHGRACKDRHNYILFDSLMV